MEREVFHALSHFRIQWPDCHDFDNWQNPHEGHPVNQPIENNQSQQGNIGGVDHGSTEVKKEESAQVSGADWFTNNANKLISSLERGKGPETVSTPFLSALGRDDGEEGNGNSNDISPVTKTHQVFQPQAFNNTLIEEYRGQPSSSLQVPVHNPSITQSIAPTPIFSQSIQQNLIPQQANVNFPLLPAHENPHVPSSYSSQSFTTQPTNFSFQMPQQQFPRDNAQIPSQYSSQGLFTQSANVQNPSFQHQLPREQSRVPQPSEWLGFPAILPGQAFPYDAKLTNPFKNEAQLKEIVWSELKNRNAWLQSGMPMNQFREVIGRTLVQYAQDLGYSMNAHENSQNDKLMGGYAPLDLNVSEIGFRPSPSEPYHRPAGYKPMFNNPLRSKGRHPDPPNEAIPPLAKVYLVKVPDAPTYLPITGDAIREVCPWWREPAVAVPVRWFPATLFTGKVQSFRAEQFMHENLTFTSLMVQHQLLRLSGMAYQPTQVAREVQPEPAANIHQTESSPSTIGPIRRGDHRDERGQGLGQGVRGRGGHGTDGANSPDKSILGPTRAQDYSGTVFDPGESPCAFDRLNISSID
ncbi:hypothetical protein TWF694_002924 [Orbilia ellipsospora]|uniref:Uncharacterized protein n=1 Tax=Orbilia ellipsospora TaxID=2528407 RepID=A0AAV9X0F5_9PEZI